MGFDRIPLRMSPNMITSIRTLEKTNQELEREINEQIFSNPILEYNPDSNKKEHDLDNIAKPVTLHEHLLDQLKGSGVEKFKECVYNINSDGYLIDCDVNEETLKMIQTLNPAGVGARNLVECLMIQIERNDGPQIAKDILTFAEALVSNKIPDIANCLGVSVDDVDDGVSYLKSLDPRPGNKFAYREYNRANVEATIDGEWNITMSYCDVPQIDEIYMALYDKTKHGKKLREKYKFSAKYIELLNNGGIQDEYHKAKGFLNGIEQRNRTLYRVITILCSEQSDYLSGTSNHPMALTMTDIAKSLDIDISTLSRAVSNKSIDTPNGIIALRSLFTHEINNNSVSAVKNEMKSFINSEDENNPYSDNEIVNHLCNSGFDIKRRTVVKYRASLEILSKDKRKKYGT